LLYFVQSDLGCLTVNSLRDKKVVGSLCVFRAPLQRSCLTIVPSYLLPQTLRAAI
jgi:hypothetical protein